MTGCLFSPPPNPPVWPPVLLKVFDIVFLNRFVILRTAESLWLAVIPGPFGEAN